MAGQKNEGEGNRSAARAYDRDQKQLAEHGKVDQAARDAARAEGGSNTAISCGKPSGQGKAKPRTGSPH